MIRPPSRLKADALVPDKGIVMASTWVGPIRHYWETELPEGSSNSLRASRKKVNIRYHPV